MSLIANNCVCCTLTCILLAMILGLCHGNLPPECIYELNGVEYFPCTGEEVGLLCVKDRPVAVYPLDDALKNLSNCPIPEFRDHVLPYYKTILDGKQNPSLILKKRSVAGVALRAMLNIDAIKSVLTAVFFGFFDETSMLTLENTKFIEEIEFKFGEDRTTQTGFDMQHTFLKNYRQELEKDSKSYIELLNAVKQSTSGPEELAQAQIDFMATALTLCRVQGRWDGMFHKEKFQVLKDKRLALVLEFTQFFCIDTGNDTMFYARSNYRREMTIDKVNGSEAYRQKHKRLYSIKSFKEEKTRRHCRLFKCFTKSKARYFNLTQLERDEYFTDEFRHVYESKKLKAVQELILLRWMRQNMMMRIGSHLKTVVGSDLRKKIMEYDAKAALTAYREQDNRTSPPIVASNETSTYSSTETYNSTSCGNETSAQNLE